MKKSDDKKVSLSELERFDRGYSKLVVEQRLILQMLSLLCAPLSRTSLIECVRAVPFKQLDARLNYNQVKEHILELIEGNFIYQTPEGLTIPEDRQSFLIETYVKENPSKDDMLAVIDSKYPSVMEHYMFSFGERYQRIYRDIRNLLFLGESVDNAKFRLSAQDLLAIQIRIFSEYFSESAFNSVDESKVADILIAVIHQTAVKFRPLRDLLDYLKKKVENTKKKPEKLIYYILLIYLLQGELDEFDLVFKRYKLPEMPFLYMSASALFMRGEIVEAGKSFAKAISMEKNYSPKRAFCPIGFFGQCYILNLIALGEAVDSAFLVKVINKALKNNKSNNTGEQFLQALAYHLAGDKVRAKNAANKYLTSAGRKYTLNSFSILPVLLTLSHVKLGYHYDMDIVEDLIEYIGENALRNGYKFHFYQASKLAPNCKKLQKLDMKLSSYRNNLKALPKNSMPEFIDMSEMIKVDAPWLTTLKSLQKITMSDKTNKNDASTDEYRLAWLFTYYEYEFSHGVEVKIQPIEQKRLKSGKWSKGRNVSLKRLFNRELTYLNDLDTQIAKTVQQHRYYYEEYSFQLEKTLPLLAKHPALFLDNASRTPVELIEEPPQLVIKEGKKGYSVSLSLEMDGHSAYSIRRETPTRYAFTVFNDKVKKIADVLAEEKKLIIPKSGEKELKDTLESITSIMPIHSNAKKLHISSDAGNVKHFDAVDTIHVHLLPVSDGVRVELFVRPFGLEGPFFKPGAGGVVIMTDLNGQPAETTRNLKSECSKAKEVLERCPSLSIRGNYDEIFHFETTDECLEFLIELEEIFDDVVVEWPEGGKLSIAGMRDMSDMQFGISSGIEWFELEGKLKINDSKVIAMNDLIEQAAKSKFIELGKGEFIALTDKLRDSLASLSVFGTEVKDKLRVHSLNVHQLDDLLDETMDFKPGKKWREQVKKIKELEHFSPEIPSTLCADLRPYQQEGVKWLAKLAEWGVGACLADDMGLGKTVQAIALLLLRAADGPSLVVAPSSVCSNWEAECRKFAPTINPVLYRESDRESIMDKMKPFDLLIVSYGLLASEQEAFEKVHWTTVILDEAQYIKNHKAKRTKAAFALQGDMRLITTGTPVENHLSELWTLFNFINPGFLGTKSNFDAKFAIPIEKNGDAQRSRDLRRVIQPFILRRIKSEVLEELPPKTEINLTVELSEEERAFYENLRQESLANLEEAKAAKGGAAHLMVLKELTKLRLASCAPSLVSDDIKIKSSKLELLGSVIEELKDNNHKALIFSQFVKHLSIIRQFCDENGISYQYLDGSTSPKERTRRVNAFQNGEGDLFLISLKAGGTGLNLTAADYVIHMDPWWNPAVEDQASDRTHRIGQQRPVTVYRMVAKGTVEEKIIKLHQTKRELADALLEGTDASAKMSLKDLISIISESS